MTNKKRGQGPLLRLLGMNGPPLDQFPILFTAARALLRMSPFRGTKPSVGALF